MRTGSSRTPCSDEPERRAHDVADQDVDDERDPERDVVEAVAVVDDVADERRACSWLIPAMPEKPETTVTWPKK